MVNSFAPGFHFTTTFITKSADSQTDRAAAEALSSIVSDVSVAGALAFASRQYESLVTTRLGEKYGQDEGLELANRTLADICSVGRLRSDQGTFVLGVALDAVQKNVFDITLMAPVLTVGVIAIVWLYWRGRSQRTMART